MEIRKIVSLSEEEVNVLVSAGKLLKAIKNAFDSGEIDAIDDNGTKLIAAVNSVSSEVVNK